MEVGIVKNDTWPQMKPISPSMQRLRCNSNQSPQLVRPADAPCSQEALPYMLSILIKPTYPPSIPEPFTFTLSLFVWGGLLLLLTSNSPVSSFPSNFLPAHLLLSPFSFTPLPFSFSQKFPSCYLVYSLYPTFAPFFTSHLSVSPFLSPVVSFGLFHRFFQWLVSQFIRSFAHFIDSALLCIPNCTNRQTLAIFAFSKLLVKQKTAPSMVHS